MCSCLTDDTVVCVVLASDVGIGFVCLIDCFCVVCCFVVVVVVVVLFCFLLLLLFGGSVPVCRFAQPLRTNCSCPQQ